MQIRKTLLMAGIFVALAAFVYFYEVRGRAAREEAKDLAERLAVFEPDQVVRASLTTADGTVVATKDSGTEWHIIEPFKLDADGNAIDSLVDAVSNAKQERVIFEVAEDLKPYGLASPVASVTLELQDGSSVSLAIGNDTPVGSSVYAQGNKDAGVLTAPASLKASLSKSLFDLRDKSVLTFSQDSVRRIEVASDSLAATLERDDDSEKWRISSPISSLADADTIDDLVDQISTDEAKAFVSESADEAALAEHGLAQPLIELTIWTEDDKAQRLMVGHQSKDPAGYYARRDGTDSIFVITEDLVDEIPEDLDALRNREVVGLQRDQIGGITLEGKDGQIGLVREGSDWRIITPRALEADASTISLLMTSLISMRAEGFASGSATDPAYGLGSPDLQVTLQPAADSADAAGEPITLLVGNATRIVPLSTEDDEVKEVDARFVTAGHDDATVYIVTEEELEDLRKDLFDLRIKTIVQFTQSDLNVMEISTPAAVTYVFERDDDDWNLTSPRAQSLDGNPLSDLLWDFNYLRMEGVAAEWEAGTALDLVPFGLAPPSYRLLARIGDEIVADLEVGGPVTVEQLEDSSSLGTANQIFVRPSGREVIYRVNDQLPGSIDELLRGLEK